MFSDNTESSPKKMAGSIVNYPLSAVVDGAHQSMMEIVHQMTCSTQLYTVCTIIEAHQKEGTRDFSSLPDKKL